MWSWSTLPAAFISQFVPPCHHHDIGSSHWGWVMKGKKWHHEQLIYKKCRHARTSINIIPPDHKSTMQAQLYMCSSEYSLLSVLLSRTHEGKVNEGTRMRVCTPFNVCMQHSATYSRPLKSRSGMDTTLCGLTQNLSEGHGWTSAWHAPKLKGAWGSFYSEMAFAFMAIR